MSRRDRTAVLVAVAALAAGTALTGSPSAGASATPWKGAETFSLVSLVPVDGTGTPDPCGGFTRAPGQVLTATFAGSGIDSVGGHFTVTVHGCLDRSTQRLYGMRAVDRFSALDSLVIRPADVSLSVDEQTCVATNRAPARFTVESGTGRFADARGSGHYDLVFHYPGCDAPPAPVHVWFWGELAPEG